MSTAIGELMERLGKAAVEAAAILATAPACSKDAALCAAAAAVRTRRGQILEANEQDMANARSGGLAAPLLDRLCLDEPRIETIARSMEEVASLPDPVGSIADEWQRPNGLRIQRVRVPLGV